MHRLLSRGVILSMLVASTLCSASAVAQGTRAPVILLLPSGTRSLALGNTGIASRDDDVIFFNPAQLSVASGVSASGEWLSSTAGTGALSGITRWGNGGVGIGMRIANYDQPAGEFPASRLSMLDAGPVAATSTEVSVGYAQTLKWSIRGGVVAKYAEDVLGGVRISRPLADVGFARDMFRSTFGLSVQNIGRELDDALAPAQLPVKTTLGFQHPHSFGEFDFVFTGAASMIRDDFFQPSGGIEANYSWLSGYNIALRGGARRPGVGEEPLTAGAGFTRDRLSIDYAMETLANRRVGHRVGVRIR